MNHTIFLNPSEFHKIFCHSSYNLVVMDTHKYELNDTVDIIEKDVSDNQPNPIGITRYVVAVLLIGNEFGECPIWSLQLSPFKNERSPLGLSRVRNSDNL